MKPSAVRQNLVTGLLGVILLASGCQSSPSLKPAGLDNNGFMSLWETYTDCRTTGDLSQASSDVKRLTSGAQVRTAGDGFVLPLPKRVERLISHPTDRLAVDVRAMAAACSLRTGQLAMDKGRPELAREFFTAVLALEQEDSSYYVLQAKTFLTDLERGVSISLNTP